MPRGISQRTKAALAAAKARGTVLGTYSAVLAADNIAEAKAFAHTVAPAVRSVQADGFISLRSMADELNRRAVPTAKGGRWHTLTVRRVLERLGEARSVIDDWHRRYNEERPHSALDYQTPAAFAAKRRGAVLWSPPAPSGQHPVANTAATMISTEMLTL